MPDQDVDLELLDHLAQTAFVITGLLGRLASRHDLSLTQLRLLGILRDRQPKMAELADHLGLEKSTVSGLVDRASQRGVVERRPDPDDARATQVGLTPQGRQLAQHGADQFADDAAFLIAPLSAPDRRRLLSLLQQIVRASG